MDFRYKCHGLFVNSELYHVCKLVLILTDYCEEFLKMSFNAIKYYVFFKLLSRIRRTTVM